MSPRAPCPPEVLALLPWYADGSLLSESERGHVEAHAARCDACRRELAWIDGSAEPEPGTLPDPEPVWARTLSRIAEADGERRRPHARRVRGRRAALAAAAGVLLALAAGLWLGRAWRPEATEPVDYRLASEPRGAASPGPQLDVAFDPDASAQRIGAVLRELRAEIVAGPSPVSGIYRVRLAPGGDALRAAQRLREEVAGFAEPLPE